MDFVETPPGAVRLHDRPRDSYFPSQPVQKHSGSESNDPFLVDNRTTDTLRPVPRTNSHLPDPSQDLSSLPSLSSSLPTSSSSGAGAHRRLSLSASPSALGNVLPNILFSTMPIPSVGPGAGIGGNNNAGGKDADRPSQRQLLLTNHVPLTLQTTSTNFRRFVPRATPVFWIQDRAEEIVMWRKGWKPTTVWMAAYVFLCYFPNLILLLPHCVLLSIILSTRPALDDDERRQAGLIASSASSNTSGGAAQPPSSSSSGPADARWQENLQAIQNLMGAVSDAYDTLIPLVPHLTHGSPYTSTLLTLTLLSVLFLLPCTLLLPTRAVFITLGIAPVVLTHPLVRMHVLPLLVRQFVFENTVLRARLARWYDDDRLEDRVWAASIAERAGKGARVKEVELWENERWGAEGAAGGSGAGAGAGVGHAGDGASGGGGIGPGGWSKANLKPGERAAWTRGQDGWSGMQQQQQQGITSSDGVTAVTANGEVSSNLTFALAPGWRFVDTESWRADVQATWAAPMGGDECGWVYTNDAWLDPAPYPPYLSSSGAATTQSPSSSPLRPQQRKIGGMTRRRRWTRRIWFDPDHANGGDMSGTMGKR